MPWIQETPEGTVIQVRVHPRSARNQIVGLQGDMLKLKLTAPPVDGAANKMCVDFLAKRLHLRKSDIEMISGHKGRSKKLLLRSAGKQAVEALLAEPAS